ncbi:MAG: rRNA pseudouridine synthase [Phycisphaerales bacterium]|nr:MAG: rRNA pseudouridine synthase [Phycisphaerales bacterium]
MSRPTPQGWSDAKTRDAERTERNERPEAPNAPASKSKHSTATIPDELKDDSRGERLQKVLAEAGVASRRACEELIEAGEVTVNGHLITELPVWVDRTRDHIDVRGTRLRFPEKFTYVMLYKPRGVITTNDDPEGRTRAIDLVKHPSRARLFPIGRLDQETSGLLLLTNDGDLTNKLMHPKHGAQKFYEVTVKGAVEEAALEKLRKGLFLFDRRKGAASRTQGAKLEIIKRDRNRTRFRLELSEGRNRQIRRMLAQMGHPVRKLRRIQMGPLKLRGLQPGQWRDLLPEEIKLLKHAVETGKRRPSRQKTRSKASQPREK